MAGGSRYDGTALGPNGRGPIPHATIAVLTQPANTSTTPGSPLATIYTDATLTTTTANPFQADVLGNFHFYADSTLGPFTIQVYGSQVQTPYVLADQAIIDPSGIKNADTYPSLQAAITAAAGAALNVTPGKVYTVSATVTIPSNTTIHWNGATVKAGTNLNADVIDLTNVTGIHFLGPLTIDGNKANQSLALGLGLGLNTNSNDNTFDILIIQNCMDSGLQIANGSSRNRFGKVYITASGGTGINVNSQGFGVKFINNANGNQFTEIDVTGSTGQGNIVLDGSTGNQIGIARSRSASFKGVLFINAAIQNQIGTLILDSNGIGSPSPLGAAGLILQSGASNPHQNTFGTIYATNNMNNGVEVQSNYNAFGSVVTEGVQDAGSAGSGFGFFMGGNYNTVASLVTRNNARDGLRIDSGQHNTFASVVALDNSVVAANTTDGVRFLSSSASATDNIIVALRSGNSIATGQRYGVNETGTSSANQIIAADLTNNQTGPSNLLTPPGTIIAISKNATFATQRFSGNGTPLVTGDFALSAGWGNTATVTGVIGTDQGWTITVTANGTGIAANPFITLTFHDGTWTNSPIPQSKMTGGTGVITALTDTVSGTQWIVSFNGTPVGASTYIISGIAMGR